MPACPLPPRIAPWTPPSHWRRTTRWRRSSPRRHRASTQRSPKSSARFRTGARNATGSISAGGRRPQSLHSGPTMARSMPSLAWASSTSRASRWGSGNKTRSARSRSLWAHTGAGSDQFRAPVPPPLDSSEYTAAFDEVKRLGGDGVVTHTERTDDQTIAGIFWAYDGTPSLCAPPRLYNQIAMQIADQMGSTGAEVARLLALVNVAMADAGIALWESKYYYEFWRPITGIREADVDGNPLTVGDPTWAPLGAPFSNGGGPPFPPNFTPPFPAYPSGHAGFGGALFQTLRNFYRTDDIAFTFVSDEFNGVTQDNQGTVRPLIPRRFSSLSQAEEENGQSRIYLGIHWAFDKTQAIAQGRRVADYVFENAFVRERGR